MYVATVPNRNSPPAILLRESYRENGKVKTRTIANVTKWRPDQIEALKAIVASKEGVPFGPHQVVRSLPHGHVAAALAVVRDLGLDKLLGSKKTPQRQLALAMVLQRALEPASKLATSRALSAETATSSLSQVLGLPEQVSPNDLYATMDWLLRRQSGIEKRLAAKHLDEGCVVLYDLTSAWVEGSQCPLAKRGYSRDGKTGKDQIEFALATDADGRPIGVEVFPGNVSDPATVKSVVDKLTQRFGLKKLILVGDRGMLTGARVREDVDPVEGLFYVTSLRKPTIRKLLDRGDIQLSLFDETCLVEVESEEFPDSRLVVCRNPDQKEAHRQRRQVRINRAVTALSKVQDAVGREDRPLRGEAAISRRVGKVFGRHRGVEKYFSVEVTEDSLTFRIEEDVVAQEARLDGMYVVRTDVPSEELAPEAAVKLYKSLSRVERDFRSMKSADIEVRPIFHRREDRVRAHVLLCMLALYVRHELEARLRESDPEPASVGPRASVRQLLRELSTLTRNFVQMESGATPGFWTTALPTAHQKRLLSALGAVA